MIDFFSELKTVGLTALFNPTFLFLLVVLFFLGKLVGWMTRNINVWKFLAVAYFGIFLFRPLQEAGLIIGGVFLLGVASMYMNLFRGIFGWAGGFGDMVSAFRLRGAYGEIRRLEREIEGLKSRMQGSPASPKTTGQSTQQASWRAQSKVRKTQASAVNRNHPASSTSQKNPPNNVRGFNQKQPHPASGLGGKQQRRPTGSASSKTQNNASRKPESQGASQTSSTGKSYHQKSNVSPASSSLRPEVRDRYLRILELPPGKKPTSEELKSAWRKMAFRTHPDKGGTQANFSLVQEAFRRLS